VKTLLKKVHLLALLWISAGCAKGENRKDGEKNNWEKDRFSEKQKLQQVKQELEKQFSLGCEKPHVSCAMTELPVPRVNLDPNAVQIMVIDQGLELASIAVHRGRVVARLEEKSNNVLEPKNPKFRAPAWFHGTLNTLNLLEGSAWKKELTREGQEFSRRFSNWQKEIQGTQNSFAHGFPTLNLISELVPNSQLTTLELRNETRRDVCIFDDEDAKQARDAWFNRGKKIAEYVKENNIRYINMSLGWDAARAQAKWRSICETEPSAIQISSFLQAYHGFFVALDTHSDAILIQAGMDTNVPISASNWQENFADCSPTKKRLRIGVALAGNGDDVDATGIPAEKKYLPYWQQNSLYCIDMFINNGKSDELGVGPRDILYTALGFGHGPANVSSTSFIAPVATGFIVKLRESNDKNLSSEEFVAKLRRAGKKIFDPFKHRQFLISDYDYINFNH
jgi:hypothetical protein